MSAKDGGTRIAYIISAYQLPELLVRLVDRLDLPGTRTLIHVDAKTPAAVHRAMARPLRGRQRVQFLPRHNCYWGDFGHVRASLKGIRALIDSEWPFDYVALLTGQDYPLKPHSEIAARLGAAEGQVFMEAVPIPTEMWSDGGVDRYENRYFRIGGRRVSFPGTPFPHRRLNEVWAHMARLLHLYRSFPANLRPWGGSSYWIFPADCARYVDAYARRAPEIIRFFRHVHVPDEMFFQTIVMNSSFRRRLADDDLRYIDWTRGGASPRVLTTDDLPQLLASDALFARKFDPTVDAEVLDRLDRAAAR